jgi:DNA-binding MarR family transcriptional regulator
VKAKQLPKDPVSDREATALDEGVAMLLQRFKLEPGIIAGSPYASLHANDVGLLVMLRQPEQWSVRRIAQALDAPISTVSSALDRLEKRSLISRSHGVEDRRIVRIELTAAGQRLVGKIRSSQVEACRAMLSQLKADDRESLIRLVTQLAQG